MAAHGGTDLPELIRSMSPHLHPTTFCFAKLHSDSQEIRAAARMIFHEDEATTVIVPVEAARLFHIEWTYECRMITLKVHSSLGAVGFIAAIAGKLTEEGLSCNLVSGYYHDHLFVPVGKEGEVMGILRGMSEERR